MQLMQLMQVRAYAHLQPGEAGWHHVMHVLPTLP